MYSIGFMPSECKDDYQAQLFSNRLAKRLRHLRKWARKSGVTCYRVYDRDIPEIPLSVDLYEFLPDGIGDKKSAERFTANEFARLAENDAEVQAEIASRSALVICLYERPYEKAESEEKAWLSKMTQAASAVVGTAENRIVVKTRKRDKGGSQYAEDANDVQNAGHIEGLIQECASVFRVSISSRIDSGLFFDHRPLRAKVRENAGGKSVLNLFCYTGSFSVYAAEGNARTVDSVDLSNTYLERAQENMALNGFSGEKKYRFIRADAAQFIFQKKAAGERYDIIILDPPTFSNSKMTNTVLDLAKDWPRLVNGCIALLAKGGVLYFSTNAKRLRFDESLIEMPAGENDAYKSKADNGDTYGRSMHGGNISHERKADKKDAYGKSAHGGSNSHGSEADKNAITVRDITASTIPEDFLQKKPHRAWEIRRN